MNAKEIRVRLARVARTKQLDLNVHLELAAL